MIWIFDQRGSFYSGNLAVSVPAYSGAGEWKCKPEAEGLADKGPIPRGSYRCGTAEDTATHGPHVIPLSPSPYNDMHGRSGFLIHGDSVSAPGTASKGCIIVPHDVRLMIQPGDLLLVWASS